MKAKNAFFVVCIFCLTSVTRASSTSNIEYKHDFKTWKKRYHDLLQNYYKKLTSTKQINYQEKFELYKRKCSTLLAHLKKMKHKKYNKLLKEYNKNKKINSSKKINYKKKFEAYRKQHAKLTDHYYKRLEATQTIDYKKELLAYKSKYQHLLEKLQKLNILPKHPDFFRLATHHNIITKKEFETTAFKFFIAHKSQQPSYYLTKYRVTPGTEIAMHADFHGNKHALFFFLYNLAQCGYLEKDNPFKIAKKNFYIALLGDYTDRGCYGVEVLYTIMRLKIENPHRVILLRGNHEDMKVNQQQGFAYELKKKFGDQNSLPLIQEIYDHLPSAVYLGVQGSPYYALLCHGGLEPRFNPHTILSTKGNYLKQKITTLNISWLSKNLQTIIRHKTKMKTHVHNPGTNTGFLWNDFIIQPNPHAIPSTRGDECADFGKYFTRKFMKECSKPGEYEIKAIFRGHQHDMSMLTKIVENNGIYNLWSPYQWPGGNGQYLGVPQYSVWTLNTPFIRDKYDTYAILKLEKEFKNWELHPIRVQMRH